MNKSIHQENNDSDWQQALKEVIAFNKRYKVGDTLIVKDSFGLSFKATLVSPASVLGKDAVVGIKEHPGCVFLRDILTRK